KWTFRSEQRRHQVGIVRWLGLQSRAIGHPLDLLGAGLGDRVGSRQGLSEKARHRPAIRRDQRKDRLFKAFVQRGRLLTEAKQQLTGGIGVVKRSMGARLREAELYGQEREAVAGRAWQQ